MSSVVFRVSAWNAYGFATGSTNSEPENDAGSSSATKRRIVSTPSGSSPWMPAIRPSRGPSPAPPRIVCVTSSSPCPFAIVATGTLAVSVAALHSPPPCRLDASLQRGRGHAGPRAADRTHAADPRHEHRDRRARQERSGDQQRRERRERRILVLLHVDEHRRRQRVRRLADEEDRRVELVEADDEAERGGGDERRPHLRQGRAQEHLPGPGAEVGGGLLERVVDA